MLYTGDKNFKALANYIFCNIIPGVFTKQKLKAIRLQEYLKIFKEEPDTSLFTLDAKALTKKDLIIIKAGNHTFKADLPPCLGGKGVTIGPVQYMLGALAGCAAGLIKNTLAPLMGVSVYSVEVNVQCHLNVGGILGMESVTPDIKNVKLTVKVFSDEAFDKIKKLFEIWKQRAPVFLCFQKSVPVSTDLIIEKPRGERGIPESR